jgi:hypothetical protein
MARQFTIDVSGILFVIIPRKGFNGVLSLVTLGKWRQDGSTLRIVLDQKKRFSFVGSGYQTYFTNIEPVTHLFTIAQ